MAPGPFCGKRGMADKVGYVLPPSKPSPRGRLSCFAPNPHFSFFFFIFCKARRRRAGMCDRREQIPQKEGDGRQSLPFFTPFQTFPSEGLVASLRDGSGPVFRQSFLHLLASLPFSFHNGSISCISLPLWNGFSAASLRWASWTALPPQSPSTTAAFPAILCRCGTSFPPHPCMGFLDGIVSPGTFHNGTDYRIFLSLR